MLKSLASCASSLASSPCMVGGALSVPNLFDAAAADDDDANNSMMTIALLILIIMLTIMIICSA